MEAGYYIGNSVYAKSLQSCKAFCDSMDCRLLGSFVHGILQARVLEWVPISFSRGSSQPRDRTQVSSIAGRRYPTVAPAERERERVCVLVAQLSQTLCNSMDWSLPGSSVHRILQAKRLEWVAISLQNNKN